MYFALSFPVASNLSENQLASEGHSLDGRWQLNSQHERACSEMWAFPAQPLQKAKVMGLSLSYPAQHGRPTISLTLLETRSQSCHHRVLARTRSFFAGSAPKCCSQVLSRLFVPDRLVDFEDFRLGEIFEGSSEAFPCQTRTWFKGLKYVSVISWLLCPEGQKGGVEEGKERPASRG